MTTTKNEDTTIDIEVPPKKQLPTTDDQKAVDWEVQQLTVVAPDSATPCGADRSPMATIISQRRDGSESLASMDSDDDDDGRETRLSHVRPLAAPHLRVAALQPHSPPPPPPLLPNESDDRETVERAPRRHRRGGGGRSRKRESPSVSERHRPASW